jgi:hypothetical protein
MAVVGKAVTASYYGKAPNFSYWNGCSTGGRQGLSEAQLYPQDFDGIMAGAPAINIPQALMTIEWPFIVMVRCNVLCFFRNWQFRVSHSGALLLTSQKSFHSSNTNQSHRTTRRAFQASASSTHFSMPALPNVMA